jgi:hypothetical protein
LIPPLSLPIAQVWNDIRHLARVPGIAVKQYSSVSPSFTQVFEYIACFKIVMLWHAVITNTTHICASFSLYKSMFDAHAWLCI